MKTKITYHPEGDYLIPDLVPPKEPQSHPRFGSAGETPGRRLGPEAEMVSPASP